MLLFQDNLVAQRLLSTFPALGKLPRMNLFGVVVTTETQHQGQGLYQK